MNLSGIVLMIIYMIPLDLLYFFNYVQKWYFFFDFKTRLLNEGDNISLLNYFRLGIGNSFPLRVVPDGIFLYSLEYNPGEYAKIARAAGSYIYIVNKFTSQVIKC